MRPVVEAQYLVADLDGTLRALALAPGACHSVHGMERAMAMVRTASADALRGAGVEPTALAVIYAGLTGADWPDEYEALAREVRALGLCERVVIKNDSIIALRGGTYEAFGAVLICGTGGNCAICAPDGREFVYGYFHDQDLQGGGALAVRTLNAVFRAATGREAETRLTEALLALYGQPTVAALCEAYFANRLPNLAPIPPLLFKLAREGDGVARKVVGAFAEGCAELLTAGLRRLHMCPLELDVVFSGSVFKGDGSLLAAEIAERVRPVAPGARFVNARYEPVVGAVLLGLQHLGVGSDPALRDRIEAGARRLGLLRLEAGALAPATDAPTVA